MLGFVIMPDHYHVASALGEAKTLSQVMYSVGRYTSGEIQRLRRTEGQFWQEGFYEHAIRDRSDLGDVLEYVHGNPVYAGLVTSPDDWPYSTANNRFAEEIDEEWLKLWLPAFRPSKYRFGRDVIPRRYW